MVGRLSLGLVAIGFVLLALAWRSGGSAGPPPTGQAERPSSKAERLRVEVVATFPHDPTAFTQGLLWHAGSLWESTGNYGASELRRVAPRTGEVLARHVLPDTVFAEGLAWVEDRLIQLTWHAGIARIYQPDGLVLIDQKTYAGKGWGLAYDGRSHLYMTDGSPTLKVLDPASFAVLRTVEITLDGRPLAEVNELEWVEGQLYGNVWRQDVLVRIDPESGVVTAIVDARGLLAVEERRRVDVLNGIAYEASSRTFWITGKYWPTMFQVRFVPAR